VNRKSVKAWCDETEPPAKWKGISTAYRAGAKARTVGKGSHRMSLRER
jgi:hypothetical protein